jgi:hypothetical protein
MQVKQCFALSVLALVAGAAMADDAASSSAPLTRAQVVQSVLAARATGQLRPAGAAGDDPQGWTSPPTTSQYARSTIENQVLTARANGELRPAGEAGDDPRGWDANDTSHRLTRAQVVAETLEARANGELVPAGEDPLGAQGYEESHFAHMRPAQSTMHATAPQIGPKTTQ